MEYAKIFYDTNALLNLQEQAFIKKFCIAQQTLEEIENIKTSSNKDNETKFKARHLAHLLNDHRDEYDVVLYDEEKIGGWINYFKLKETPDNIICASAYEYWRLWCDSDEYNDEENFLFCTDDLNCAIIAREVFCMFTCGIQELDFVKDTEEYKGWKDITLSDGEMSYFYSNMDKNVYDLLVNEYLIIRKSDGEIVDTLRWTANGEYKKVCSKTVKSFNFGDKIKPKDIYQSCAIDSIMNNTLTVLSGKPGSGKSLISLVTIMSLIESGKYDRVIIMYNPTKARGAMDSGFFPGSSTEKAMQSFCGQVLISKLGDRFAVDLLIQQDKLRLVSMADVRGMEVRDNEILYITEVQNTTADLLKLCLSRASKDCKIIIEGDYETQVDSYLFGGMNNGMKRAIDVLSGEEEFGYVNLPNIWRSKIAQLVDKL